MTVPYCSVSSVETSLALSSREALARAYIPDSRVNSNSNSSLSSSSTSHVSSKFVDPLIMGAVLLVDSPFDESPEQPVDFSSEELSEPSVGSPFDDVSAHPASPTATPHHALLFDVPTCSLHRKIQLWGVAISTKPVNPNSLKSLRQ